MTDTAPLSHEELLRLWERGRRMALACCFRSLHSLRRGYGGFYEADDLWQDLFLEFWELARRWYSGPTPRCVDHLWAAWRRRLQRGGYRVLRRRPQRLWRRREKAVDPVEMELDAYASDEQAPSTPDLTPAAREALMESADPEEAWGLRAVEEAAGSDLLGLSATDRQALYLTAVAGLSSMEAARCLQLVDAQDVRRRAHRARDAVRRGARSSDSPSERGVRL